MSRLKLLAAAMLLALPIISACGEDIPPPPPTGLIDGLVSIEGQGTDGVSVTLSNGAVATTANGGMFRFDGVEAGAYTVTISNYPDDASFAQTSAAATIATDGETVTINFPGTWIRTSAIMGTVTVENEGLGGVTVKLSGMSDSETLTDANGQYAFTGLRAGNYTVEISGFDEDDVAFSSVASTAELAVGESKVVPFEGTYLRTSAITGQVSVEGTGLADVTVSLQGRGEERTATTNGAGQYTFSELRSGDYSVGMTNPNADEYGFDVTSKTVTISHGETASVPFDGILLRTAAIMGTVTVEGTGIADVAVSVQGEGATLEGVTNAAGQFSFTELHAGDYSIGITGYDDDLYGFDVTTATVTVALQETASVPFEGIMLRTAGIAGTVTVEGHPIPGVTVTVTGGPKDEEHTRTTNDAGYYMVDKLHAGDYAVAISDFDANEYEFEATAQSISVGLSETATVAFQGDLLRTAGISGRVSVEGVGLDGINVTLSGDADMTMVTADGGQYAFTGLAEGDYTVAIDGWDADAYAFETASADLEVAQDAAAVQNFEGTHTRTASVRGMLFLDEVNADSKHTEGEPPFAHAGVPLLLQGPGINDVRPGMTGDDGSYAFENLVAGSYRVLINMNDAVAAELTAGGFRFAGELTGQVVSVAAAEAATVNFPFQIVMQTIRVEAVMGNDKSTGDAVAGVKLAMYPTSGDAANGTNGLGTATTDTTGYAKFDFARAMDLGPGGQGTDHLVFVKVTESGHDDLAVSGGSQIEIAYEAVDRVSEAPAKVRLLNTRANFQWWVKSNAEARGGDQPLPHWKVTMGKGDDAVSAVTGNDGKATHTTSVDVADLPAKFTIALDTIQADSVDGGERWRQTAALSHTHDGLTLPADNKAEDNDIGLIRITWTTQTLVLGVYREADDVPGYSDYRSPGLPRGDHRPNTAARQNVGAEMKAVLTVMDDGDRPQPLKYDHDFNPKTDPIEATGNFGKGGMLRIRHLPAHLEIEVDFSVGPNRIVVGNNRLARYVRTYGGDLEIGSSVGAFGDMSGAGPEVRLCPASDSSDDEWCATYGYQWQTGHVSGTVGKASGHQVVLAALTDSHGAKGDSARTLKGKYAFRSLRDGEYSVTAHSTSDWKIKGKPTQNVAAYHDEFTDDEDSLTTYVGTRGSDTADWDVTELGLAFMGYVANDGDENNLIRGDREALPGLEVRLLTNVTFITRPGDSYGHVSNSKTVATTETATNGFYSFEGLEEGKYWIQVVPNQIAGGFRSLLDPPNKGGGNLAGGQQGLEPAHYPTLPREDLFPKPYWIHIVRVSENQEVTIPPDGTEAADTATLHNFALVYTNGSFLGRVDNISGGDEDIDINITTVSEEDKWDVVTDRVGAFEVTGLMEDDYTAKIEDRGWSFPCLTSNGKPDDDARHDHDSDPSTPDICTTTRESLTATLRGPGATQSVGPLYVYDSDMSADEAATQIGLLGRSQGDNESSYAVADTFAYIVSLHRIEGTATTTHPRITNLISHTPGTVTVDEKLTSLPDGAEMTIRARHGSCKGRVCTLDFHKTGSTEATDGDAKPDTIDVTVTAANGYNDHVYSVIISRAAPIGNTIANTNIINADSTGHTATNGGGNVFNFTTATGVSTANIRFTLAVLGVPGGDNAFCAQSVSVIAHGSSAAEKASEDDDGDDCENTRYSLPAGEGAGNPFHVDVTSEDGVKNRYRLNVIKGT